MLSIKTESHNINKPHKAHTLGEAPPKRGINYLSYKTMLLFSDIACLGLATRFCLSHFSVDAATILGLLIVSSILFFMHNFRLYSYHLIFSLYRHLIGIGKTFICSVIMLVMVVAMMENSENVLGAYSVPATIAVAAIFVALSRKHNWDLSYLLYPAGLSYLVIGIFEILRGKLYLGNEIIWMPLVVLVLVAYLLLAFSRYLLVHLVFNRIFKQNFRRQLLIVGSNNEANRFAKHIVDLNAPFWVVGIVHNGQNGQNDLTQVPNKRYLGNIQELAELAKRHSIGELVVTTDEITKQELIKTLDVCKSRGINVWFSPYLMPIIDIKLYIDSFCGQPMIRLCSQKRSWLFYKIKHISDALVTLPVFILQLPFFLVLMAAVKMTSKGPVFYKAKAIGKGGRPFNMLKFRSMHLNSDKSIHQKYVTKLIRGDVSKDAQQNGPLKITDDPRITKVGRILRKYSMDELPQLINVLKGEMSLVGPRPCLPYEYDIYQDWHKKRTAVRPGITGLWQVTGRSEVLFEDMILLDLYYIYNGSQILDLQILFETIFVVLGKKGAY
jgi:exopolysaccharide biosynthesis polyprenyl glycosylphosphotransferase